MKNFLFLGLLSVLTCSVFAASKRQSDSDIAVEGYYRSNGTYVKPYYRSAPNAYKWDNYNYEPSQSRNNNTYGQSRNSNWYKPNPGRFNDDNTDNDQ